MTTTKQVYIYVITYLSLNMRLSGEWTQISRKPKKSSQKEKKKSWGDINQIGDLTKIMDVHVPPSPKAIQIAAAVTKEEVDSSGSTPAQTKEEKIAESQTEAIDRKSPAAASVRSSSGTSESGAGESSGGEYVNIVVKETEMGEAIIEEKSIQIKAEIQEEEDDQKPKKG